MLALESQVVEAHETTIMEVNIPPESAVLVQLALAVLSLGIVDAVEVVDPRLPAQTVSIAIGQRGGRRAGESSGRTWHRIVVQQRQARRTIAAISDQRARGVHPLDSPLRLCVPGRTEAGRAEIYFTLRLPPERAWTEPLPVSRPTPIEAIQRQLLLVHEGLRRFSGVKAAREVEQRVSALGRADLWGIPENARSIAEGLERALSSLEQLRDRIRHVDGGA